MEYDFSGWATRPNIRCSDGRIIMPNAFMDNDGQRVPLVWGHKHNDPSDVLGHAILENRGKDGVYAYCKLNESESGKTAKLLVKHGDVDALSIYANQLKQDKSCVLHGNIREVSLVLAGANPGAYIDNIIMHGEESSEEAIIYNHSDDGLLWHEDATIEDLKPEPKEINGNKKPETLKKGDNTMGEDRTIGEIFDELTDEQKQAVYAIIGMTVEDKDEEAEAAVEHAYQEGAEDMKYNIFEQMDNGPDVLSHDAMSEIIADGEHCGSLRDSALAHAAEYGVDQIDMLFPEYKSVNGNTPEFIKRTPDGWIDTVMNGVKHSPFSRIKMMFADLREDEARARGYMKGNLKKEEVFGLLKRTVDPCTIYKKQKLDRDDVIDITDFDVVAWLKGEMRMKLDEEIARAILFGDGRSTLAEDKINESNIIPIIKDAPLYTIQKTVTPDSGEELGHAIIKNAVKAQDDYEGSGNTTMFTAASTITDMLLLEDKDGRRMYKDMNELALAMNVNKIVKVPASIIPSGIYGVIVDLNDYNVGADKGGAVNMFDDFDIDYNQQKYLIETRCSGALTKPYSAIVLKANA